MVLTTFASISKYISSLVYVCVCLCLFMEFSFEIVLTSTSTFINYWDK